MKKILMLVLMTGLAITGCQTGADTGAPADVQAEAQTEEQSKVQSEPETTDQTETDSSQEVILRQGDIVDRNGNILNLDGSNEIGGIEQSYQEQLMSGSVVSTIDANIQASVEKYIAEWQNETGADHVGVVIMNPANGELLAMASDDETGNSFCLSSTYEPGSLAQTFTVAGALEEGLLTGSETFDCDGSETIGDFVIRCGSRSGHGTITLEESLMYGCNDAMMQIAAMEGPEIFSEYQQLFGFGSKTGIDLPGEADTTSLIYSAENMDLPSLATNSFGQNYNCTMIQMAAAYSSLINGGTYYRPYVVKQVLDSQGTVLEDIQPEPLRTVISEETSAMIRNALGRTVAEGTGKAAAVEGYEIAGKSGTAEKLPRGQGNYLVSFCGFAPADDPQVLVYVVIDTPHTEDQARSSYASELSGKIMSEIMADIVE